MAKTYTKKSDAENWKNSSVEVKETKSTTMKIEKSYEAVEAEIAMLEESKASTEAMIEELKAELAEIEKVANV